MTIWKKKYCSLEQALQDFILHHSDHILLKGNCHYRDEHKSRSQQRLHCGRFFQDADLKYVPDDNLKTSAKSHNRWLDKVEGEDQCGVTQQYKHPCSQKQATVKGWYWQDPFTDIGFLVTETKTKRLSYKWLRLWRCYAKMSRGDLRLNRLQNIYLTTDASSPCIKHHSEV